MKIALGADHAGYEYKSMVAEYLKSKGYEIIDFGTNSTESVDYPDFAHPVATAVESKEVDLGMVFCGSGNGISMTANKHQEIRAAICWTVEIAELARQHNDANILSIPARFISKEEAIKIVDAFLATKFEGGRHQTRVDKMKCI